MSGPEMKFEVRNQAVERMLKAVGEQLRDACPPGVGFALLVFSFGEGGSMFYISNAQRESIIRAMLEFIEKFSEN